MKPPISHGTAFMVSLKQNHWNRCNGKTGDGDVSTNFGSEHGETNIPGFWERCLFYSLFLSAKIHQNTSLPGNHCLEPFKHPTNWYMFQRDICTNFFIVSNKSLFPNSPLQPALNRLIDHLSTPNVVVSNCSKTFTCLAQKSQEKLCLFDIEKPIDPQETGWEGCFFDVEKGEAHIWGVYSS